MATGDLYYNRLHFSTNNRAWAWGLWVQEIDPSSDDQNAEIVALAVSAHFNASLLPCLSTESRFESVSTWKRHGTAAMPGTAVQIGSVGTRGSGAIPNDNAVVISLRQSAAAAKHNGQIFHAGQIQSDLNVNEWAVGYVNVQLTALAARFTLNIAAVSPASGTWRPVVVSETLDPPSTPVGTPLDITSAVPKNRVYSQRRRGQRVEGYSQ